MENLDHVAKNQPHPQSKLHLPPALLEALAVVVTIAIVLWLWEVIADVKQLPTFFLPKPSVIGARFVEAVQHGTLISDTAITWSEALVAFALAFIFASVVGYVLAKSPLLEKIISPYLLASQSLPIIAIAPFVLIWLGNGFTANVFMGAMVAFFPMLINTIAGIRNISAEQRELLYSFAADQWQTFFLLELPASLPMIFAGARVGITLSVIGVIIVELVWADRGIGYLLNSTQRGYDTPLFFSAVLMLLIMNLTMYIALALLQRLIMPWRYIPRDAS